MTVWRPGKGSQGAGQKRRLAGEEAAAGKYMLAHPFPQITIPADPPPSSDGGSAWMAPSRTFVEFMICGWDNPPRTLLMYHVYVISSPEFYFRTLLCNSPGFSNTVVNSDPHYISWDNPPKQHPRPLGLKDFRRMVLSNAPFAESSREMIQYLTR
ncbi:hypothetical protein SUGI_0337620 [Cryptomeria japonica]|nr:hypothetical protein SUGI_0337620 [Cryptomeria japonica]